MSWSTLEAIHMDYVTQVVEDLDVCPFARRSRNMGRVLRPMFFVSSDVPEMGAVADVVAQCVVDHPDVEIILLTFICPQTHAWHRPDAFEAGLRQLREAYEQASHERFYMVSFHPNVDASKSPTPDNFVSQLRRTPDPVIQCVRSDVLDQVRKQANERKHLQMLDELERQYGPMEPGLKATLLASAPENHLSAGIAQKNFETCATGDKSEQFEEIIDALNARRRALDSWVASSAESEISETNLLILSL